jgi:hypothetical protein
MQRTTGVIGALILAIAIYFTLFWGYDAIRILTSPAHGLEDVWRSQVVFGIGSYAGFGPEALIRLAAALGALKLVVAGVCAVHVFKRTGALFGKTMPASEGLETALIVAVLISIASLMPAVSSHNGDLAREQLIQLVLAGLAGVFCMIERGRAAPAEEAEAVDELQPVAADGGSYMPWRR